MDFEKAIEDAIKTGKVKIGSKETIKSIENEESQLVILAKNCPRQINLEINEKAQENGIKIIETKYNNYQLGKISGRPHSIAAMSINEPGKSGILGIQRIGGVNE
ncbi:50S ribosomal protein L30e [archaeon SCG-AAA382B04]|nr:50S ribosomal protein L30e [archaeon SCG-AAA382B04]